jgi:DNA-binding MarR family transcriptional regulator
MVTTGVREQGNRALGLPTWRFLTNQAVVLIYVITHPESTVREIAEGIDITERATLAMLRNLDEDDIVARHRHGRRNTYSVDFARLSSVRRGGTSSPLTPRPFVEAVVRALFELASSAIGGGPVAKAPKRVRSHELEARAGTWGFFTNHMLVLLAIAENDSRTLRQLAKATGITERAVVDVLGQLTSEGIVTRGRVGRRNSYRINVSAFKRFRGWTFATWRIPVQLIDVATDAIRDLAARA